MIESDDCALNVYWCLRQIKYSGRNYGQKKIVSELVLGSSSLSSVWSPLCSVTVQCGAGQSSKQQIKVLYTMQRPVQIGLDRNFSFSIVTSLNISLEFFFLLFSPFNCCCCRCCGGFCCYCVSLLVFPCAKMLIHISHILKSSWF